MNTSKIRTVLFLATFFALIADAGHSKAASPSVYKSKSPTRLITVIDQNITCEEDGSVQITLDAKGPNDVVLSYGTASRPPYGTLTKTEGNIVTYTPNPDYFGQDSFRFSAYSKEAHIGDTYGTISITVTPVPDKPIALNIEVTTAENSPVEIDLAAYDPDGGKLKYTIKNQPKHGELKLIDEASNIYLYTPKTGYKGGDKFYFYVNNGSYDSNMATVNINITQESENSLPKSDQVNVTRLLEPLKVETPVDLVIERKGNLYILSAPENGQSKVLVCDNNLHLQRSFDIDAKNPRSIAISDNKLYVADTGGNRILRYAIDGNIDSSFGNNGSIGQAGEANGQFNKPWSVGVDWDKNIYVTDSGNDRIQIFNLSGKFKAQWQQKISYYKPGTLTPKSFRNDNRAYEEYLRQLSSQPYRINNSDRIPAADRTPLKNPTGFCLSGSSSNGQMFLVDSGNDKIKRLSAQSGNLYAVTGQKGKEPGSFNQPVDIAYDYEMDKLFVADTGNNRIQVFQLFNHGGPMTCVQQIDDQKLSGPMAVASMTEQPNQFIYIADTGNNRVIKLQNGLFRPGASPVDVWEKFKDALRKNDINKALTFITPHARDEYAQFFKEIKPHLKEYVNGMGKLTPESIEG